MAGAVIKVRLDDDVKALMQRLDAACSSPGKAMQIIGTIVTASARKNFIEGGRPDKWQSSASADRDGRKTLVEHGHLMKSITYKLDRNSVYIGTNRKYAAVHQFGIDESVSVPAHTRRIKTQLGAIKSVNVQAYKRHMKLPARPYLMVHTEDWDRIRKVIKDYLERVQK